MTVASSCAACWSASSAAGRAAAASASVGSKLISLRSVMGVRHFLRGWRIVSTIRQATASAVRPVVSMLTSATSA